MNFSTSTGQFLSPNATRAQSLNGSWKISCWLIPNIADNFPKFISGMNSAMNPIWALIWSLKLPAASFGRCNVNFTPNQRQSIKPPSIPSLRPAPELSTVKNFLRGSGFPLPIASPITPKKLCKINRRLLSESAWKNCATHKSIGKNSTRAFSAGKLFITSANPFRTNSTLSTPRKIIS